MILMKNKRDLMISICNEKTENLRKKNDLKNNNKKRTSKNIRAFQICRFKKRSSKNKVNKITLESKQRYGNKI